MKVEILLCLACFMDVPVEGPPLVKVTIHNIYVTIYLKRAISCCLLLKLLF